MPRQVPLEYQIAELERELGIRARVYPRWMQTNKIKPETASAQVERMEAARDTLIALRAERAGAALAAQSPTPPAPAPAGGGRNWKEEYGAMRALVQKLHVRTRYYRAEEELRALVIAALKDAPVTP